MLQWLTSHQILMTDPERLHDCNAEVKPVLYCFTYAALTHSTRQPMVVSMIKSSSGLECTKQRREKESEHARKEMANISLLKQKIWTVEKKLSTETEIGRIKKQNKTKNSLKWYTNSTLCFNSHGHKTGLTNGMSFIFTLCFPALCWELWWPTSHLRLWVSPFVNNFLFPLSSLTFPSCPLRLNPHHYQWQQRNWKAYITLRGRWMTICAIQLLSDPQTR